MIRGAEGVESGGKDRLKRRPMSLNIRSIALLSTTSWRLVRDSVNSRHTVAAPPLQPWRALPHLRAGNTYYTVVQEDMCKVLDSRQTWGTWNSAATLQTISLDPHSS
jgi:hypothetical protein